MALFRVDFSGRGELAERQQKLAQMLSRLQKISEGGRNISQVKHMILCNLFSLLKVPLRLTDIRDGAFLVLPANFYSAQGHWFLIRPIQQLLIWF